MFIKQLVRKNVLRVKPYQATEISCKVKLDANEGPYSFDDALKSVKYVKTNAYPDPEAKALRNILAKSWGVKSENILHGNGSDELIYYLILTFGGPVMFPVPTFSMYKIIANVLNEDAIGIPLNKDFELDKKKMLTGIRTSKPLLVFLSSPNNPTGNCFDRDTIIEIIRSSKGLVVVDEAYQPFSSEKSFTQLIKIYPNLVVMKTLSKIGLAALRSGFIVSGKEIIKEVNKVRLPFNVNSLSQEVAIRALKNRQCIRDTVNVVTRERAKLFLELKNLKGIHPFPSEANFILFRIRNAERIFKMLLKRGILLRNMTNVIRDCLRVTIGKPEHNRIFVGELKRILKGLGRI